MNNSIKEKLNAKAGYVIMPRVLAEHIINTHTIDNIIDLYSYLLLHANYSQQKTGNHEIIQRGELSITIRQIAKDTGCSYDHIQRLMKRLEKEELISYHYEDHHRHIVLSYYEQHCGHKVRKEEHDKPAQNKTDEEFDLFWQFYHEQVHVSPTDWEKARRAYGKLSLKERDMAIKNVELYYNSLVNESHAKWAVNYLKDKSFILPNT